jgi:hypothetical protein
MNERKRKRDRNVREKGGRECEQARGENVPESQGPIVVVPLVT